MEIFKRILRIAFVFILLYSTVIILRHTHKDYYDSRDDFLYSRGNAPEDVRSEIVRQLNVFQDGYARRDTTLLTPFMEQLFSQQNVLVLGTMPNEILRNHERARALVSSDWRTWGDCTFLMDNAHISTSGNVAWVSTIGYVQFDLSRFLVLPLRFSAVLVKETDAWRFQYMQFQFDLDFSFLLLTFVLLTLWFVVNLAGLSVAILRRMKDQNRMG